MFRTFSLGILLMATPSGANAADWAFAGTNDDGTWFVDRETVERKGDVRTFWNWSKMHNGTSNLAHVRINCTTKVFQIFYLDARDANGRLAYSGASLPEDNAPPGSVIDHAWEVVCR